MVYRNNRTIPVEFNKPAPILEERPAQAKENFKPDATVHQKQPTQNQSNVANAVTALILMDLLK